VLAVAVAAVFSLPFARAVTTGVGADFSLPFARAFTTGVDWSLDFQAWALRKAEVRARAAVAVNFIARSGVR
jgi:hypothetical protein